MAVGIYKFKAGFIISEAGFINPTLEYKYCSFGTNGAHTYVCTIYIMYIISFYRGISLKVNFRGLPQYILNRCFMLKGVGSYYEAIAGVSELFIVTV